MPLVAAELVRRRVSVIVAFGSPAAAAAKNATTLIPLIFQIGVDPIREGLVPSLNKPGGNITGVVNLALEVGPTASPRSSCLLVPVFSRRGGLISYGVDTKELFANAALYVDRIMRGVNPADLPVQQPTKFEAGDQSENGQGARHRCAAAVGSQGLTKRLSNARTRLPSREIGGKTDVNSLMDS